MSALHLISMFVQSVAIFAAALGAMIFFGRHRAPPTLESMNERSMQRFEKAPSVELKTFFARDGVELAYREFTGGAKHVAVLIHGSSADSRSMQAIGLALASQSITAYALDMRGHGASGRRGDVDYVGQLEDDLVDFVRHLRTKFPEAKFSLVGHSSGGGFSLRFGCGKFGTLFDRYILAAPFIHHAVATTRPNSGGWTRVFMPRLIALIILNSIGLKWFQNLPVLAFALPPGRDDLTGFYSFRMQANFRPDTMKWKEQIKNLQRPVDVVVGENDELFIANAYAPLLTPLSPHISVHVMPELRHLDFYLEPVVFDTIARLVKSTD